MSFNESYRPTPEETAKAEAMMTPEQRAASEERERFKFQERAPFGGEKTKFTPDMKRRPPTPEERRGMDADLIQLGDLFADSGIRWQLDGAINVSLLTKPAGEYIGAHKDVDVSVFLDDIGKLDAHLGRRGYGLFESRHKDPTDPDSVRVMERLGAAGITGRPEQNLLIARIDASGKLAEGPELDFIDLHAVRPGPDGRPIGPFGAPLPEKWYRSRRVDFQGRELRVSDPSLVAYFKLRQGRSYDMDDIRHLVEADLLTRAEFDEIAAVIEGDLAARREMVADIVGDVLARIGAAVPADRFIQALLEHPRVVGRLTDPEDPQLKELAQALAGRSKLETAAVTDALIEVFGLGRYDEEQSGKLRQLEAMIREREDQAGSRAARRDPEALGPDGK